MDEEYIVFPCIILVGDEEYSSCRFITVDAYRESEDFYIKNDFLHLLKETPADQPTIPMYFDLMKAAIVNTGE